MKNGNTTLIILISIVALLSVAGFGYMYMQNQKLEKEIAKELDYPLPTEVESVESSSPSPTPMSENETVVVFESEASFPSSDKSQIQARIVDPVIDYYDIEMDSPAVSIKVKINTAVNKADYPYLFEYILKNGVNGGGVITKTNGQISWWFPECMMGCDLSEEFTSKYPEISKLVN